MGQPKTKTEGDFKCAERIVKRVRQSFKGQLRSLKCTAGGTKERTIALSMIESQGEIGHLLLTQGGLQKIPVTQREFGQCWSNLQHNTLVSLQHEMRKRAAGDSQTTKYEDIVSHIHMVFHQTYLHMAPLL